MPGPLELLIILFIVLLIFGPAKLPKLGRALGETVRGIRQAMNRNKEDQTDTGQK